MLLWVYFGAFEIEKKKDLALLLSTSSHVSYVGGREGGREGGRVE
jgi:hypothetical protein